MSDTAQDQERYISLARAAKLCPYSQDYLSLRARQGKLKAKKLGRNWITTQEWIFEYLKEYAEGNKLKNFKLDFNISPVARNQLKKVKQNRIKHKLQKRLRFALNNIIRTCQTISRSHRVYCVKKVVLISFIICVFSLGLLFRAPQIADIGASTIQISSHFISRIILFISDFLIEISQTMGEQAMSKDLYIQASALESFERFNDFFIKQVVKQQGQVIKQQENLKILGNFIGQGMRESSLGIKYFFINLSKKNELARNRIKQTMASVGFFTQKGAGYTFENILSGIAKGLKTAGYKGRIVARGAEIFGQKSYENIQKSQPALEMARANAFSVLNVFGKYLSNKSADLAHGIYISVEYLSASLKNSARKEQISGSALVPAFAESYTVYNDKILEHARIFVIFRGNPKFVSWWIDDVSNGKFTLKLSSSLPYNLPIDYWVSFDRE